MKKRKRIVNRCCILLTLICLICGVSNNMTACSNDTEDDSMRIDGTTNKEIDSSESTIDEKEEVETEYINRTGFVYLMRQPVYQSFSVDDKDQPEVTLLRLIKEYTSPQFPTIEKNGMTIKVKSFSSAANKFQMELTIANNTVKAVDLLIKDVKLVRESNYAEYQSSCNKDHFILECDIENSLRITSSIPTDYSDERYYLLFSANNTTYKFYLYEDSKEEIPVIADLESFPVYYVVGSTIVHKDILDTTRLKSIYYHTYPDQKTFYTIEDKEFYWLDSSHQLFCDSWIGYVGQGQTEDELIDRTQNIILEGSVKSVLSFSTAPYQTEAVITKIVSYPSDGIIVIPPYYAGKTVSLSSFLKIDCDLIHTVYLPHSITSIPSNTFSNIGSLDTIYFEGTQKEWNRIKFEQSIPKSVQVIYDSSYVIREEMQKEHSIKYMIEDEMIQIENGRSWNDFSRTFEWISSDRQMFCTKWYQDPSFAEESLFDFYQWDGNDVVLFGKVESIFEFKKNLYRSEIVSLNYIPDDGILVIPEQFDGFPVAIGMSAIQKTALIRILYIGAVSHISTLNFQYLPNLTEVHFAGSETTWKEVGAFVNRNILEYGEKVTMFYDSPFVEQ